MLNQLSVKKRLSLILQTVCIALITGIILSFNLWISDRFYPLASVFNFIPPLASPFDSIAAILLILLLLAIYYNFKSFFIYAALTLLIMLLLQDQNRWQPWIYLYMLFLIPYLLFPVRKEIKGNLLPYFQLILIAVYIWSGIHKLHPNFINITFKSILADLFRIHNPETINSLKPFGYGVGIVEIIIGLTLLLPQSRKAGVWLATCSHIFIILYLSPLGINHNYAVLPWNIEMIILIFLCFYNTDSTRSFWPEGNPKFTILTTLAVILTWLLPALNFIGLWDHYLSFALYSDKVNDYYIVVGESEIQKIDSRFRKYFKESDKVNGGEIIDVNAWSLGELNVPVYPESRVFKQIGMSFCNLNITEGQLFFLEFQPPAGLGNVNRFICRDLNP